MRVLSLLLSLTLLQTQIRVDVRLQQVIVTVRDDKGELVKKLKADDLVREDDGATQAHEQFAEDNDTHVKLGILVDTRGSMAEPPPGSLTAMRAAEGTARLLIHLMKPQDEFQLMSLESRFHVEQPFTQSTD